MCMGSYRAVPPHFERSKYASQHITQYLMVFGQLVRVEDYSVLFSTLTITNRNLDSTMLLTVLHR